MDDFRIRFWADGLGFRAPEGTRFRDGLGFRIAMV